VKKIWLGFSLILMSSLIAGLSGCYYRGHDDGYRKDKGHHEERKDHDDHKGYKGDGHDNRNGEH
jgi:hypothetical protein